MTSPNTPVDVEAVIESLAGVSVTACRQVPGVVAELCLSSAHGLSRLLAERREMLEALKKIAEGDYRIISGSPGPLFDADWNACAPGFVERLRAMVTSSISLPDGRDAKSQLSGERVDDSALAERSAHILGDASAAAMALADRDERRRAGQDAGIWLRGNTWVVGPFPARVLSSDPAPPSARVPQPLSAARDEP